MSLTESDHTSYLFEDICALINNAKGRLASTANAEISMLYWKIGDCINTNLLDGQRAQYGQQIVSQLAAKLRGIYGRKGFDVRNLRRMMQFAKFFPDIQIVSQAATQLRELKTDQN